jgi:ferredoxin/flavodoxin---NADP+ reductase
MSEINLHRAELIERRDFSKDLSVFKFRPDLPLKFRPGQFVNLGVEEGGTLVERAYSIVSSPYEPFLELFIELVPPGDLTPRLWNLKVGDTVLVRDRIAGNFTLREKSGMTRHLMAATVTGIAPFISMVRTQRIEMSQGKESPHQFLIVHGASHSSEFGIYMDELTEIARDGWLTYIPTVSRPWEDTEWKGERGRIEDVIRKYGDQFGFDYTNSVAYACGHPQMIENVKEILTRAGFPRERIRKEKYFELTKKE